MWRSSSASADPSSFRLPAFNFSSASSFLTSFLFFFIPSLFLRSPVSHSLASFSPPSQDGPFLKSFPLLPVQSVPRRHSALNAHHEHQPSIQSVLLRRPSLSIYRHRLRCPRSACQVLGRWLSRCRSPRPGPSAVQPGKGEPPQTSAQGCNGHTLTDGSC